MNTDKNLAIVFPGQGSQSVGMMHELSLYDPDIKQVFGRASNSLGYDLWQLVSEGPDTELNKTEITQPAMLAAGYATWLCLQKKSGAVPSLLAGHSLGEYTALVCAKVIEFEDAISLVAERGRCMQTAVPEGVGAMAAILGLEDEKVGEVCAESAQEEIVSAANFNSPGQVVIAGHKSAVERAVSTAKDAGAKRAMILPVSVPSHCLLMQQAADKFSNKLNEIAFNEAVIPVIQNVDTVVRTNATEIKSVLLEQLYKPVQWVKTIHEMKSIGITKIIECGPGKVLAGLIKHIDRGLNISFIQDEKSLENALT